jgi:pilus assembly protein Flp/PilA
MRASSERIDTGIGHEMHSSMRSMFFDTGTKMTKIAQIANRLWKEDEGQDLIEYALLVALIALAAAASFPPVATAIKTVFTNAQTQLQST